jgi:hypothetical protein
MGNDLVSGYPSTLKVLEGFEVAGLEAPCLAVDSVYGFRPLVGII